MTETLAVTPAGSWWWSEIPSDLLGRERTVSARAERLLADLFKEAQGIADPAERRRELASIQRLWSDPTIGYGRRFREARTDAIRADLVAGTPILTVAEQEGTSVRQIRYLTRARRPVPAGAAAAAHRSAMATRRVQNEQQRAEKLAEAGRWLDLLEAGTVTRDQIASAAGLSARQLRDRLATARKVRAASGLAGNV